MPPCTHCGKITDATERPKKCAHCRAVVYCGVECQKGNWQTHKTTCKPCSTYAFEKATLAYEANDWRKTLKWSEFFETFMRRNIQPGRKIDSLRIVVLRIFALAYEQAADSTGEPHYAHSCLPILREQIAIYGKYERVDEQVEAICTFGRLLAMTLNDTCDEQVIASFQRARDIGAAHGSKFAECVTCLALGQAANAQRRHTDAKNLLRAALAASKLGDGTESFAKMATREMDCSSVFIEVLLDTGAYDEAEAEAIRFPSVLRTAFGMNPKKLRPMHLYSHLQLARVHGARGRYAEMSRELRKLIDLVNKNNDAVLEWRLVFVSILQAIIKLVMFKPENGSEMDLLIEITKMSNSYGVPVSGVGSDGIKWEQILI